MGDVRGRAYRVKRARHLEPVAMPRPQEDDVRLTVDHRQHAIDPTMGAERRLAAINPLINLLDIKDGDTVEAAGHLGG
jgi:hypothetical protein